jgi:hypothetical protein
MSAWLAFFGAQTFPLLLATTKEVGGIRGALKAKLMLLSPLGERLGEGVMQEAVFALHPLT